MKVFGGILNVLSVYIPHDGHDLEYRQHIFDDLSKYTRRDHDHESTLVSVILMHSWVMWVLMKNQLLGSTYSRKHYLRNQVFRIGTFCWSIALLMKSWSKIHFSTIPMNYWCHISIYLQNRWTRFRHKHFPKLTMFRADKIIQM